MIRRRIGWTAMAVAVCGVAVFGGAGCRSAKISGGGLEIELVGDDGFILTARGFEEALKIAMAHVKDLQKSGAPDPAAIGDWNRIIADLIDAKKNAGQPVPSTS
jgi:hypothetical protein